MSYKNTLSSRTHKYIRHIISAHCALSILLFYCVQSSTLTDMHARVFAAQTLTCIINIAIILFEPLNTQSFASRSSISSPYRQATQDLQPLLGTPSTLQRLVQCSTNISPASSLRQEPKSNPHHQSKPSNIFSATRIPHRQQQQATKISILLADKCSSPIRWPSSMRIDSCRWTSSMRIDSCRWIGNCRRTPSIA